MSEIDVSKCIYCEYYNDGICNQTTLYAPTSKQVALCKDIDCCFIKDFFKQLQQFKAENEKLKTIIKQIRREVKWVVDNKGCFEVQDVDRCERILRKIKEVSNERN